MVLCRECGHAMVRRATYYLCPRCKTRWPREAAGRARRDRKAVEKRTVGMPLGRIGG